MGEKTDENGVTEAAAGEDSVKVIELAETTNVGSEEMGGLRGIALSLSGGGYRAMLFHLGTIRRLNELRYLPKLDRISSVSGGSITAGVLALKWSALAFENGVARNFEPLITKPLRDIGARTIDSRAIVRGVLSLGSIGDQVTKAYRQLFRNSTLQDLPDRPRFVINATNVQSGVLWRFSKPYTWDYRVGQIKNPRIELAVAVAASAAFPPILSPIRLKFDESAFTPDSGTDLQLAPFRTKVVLTDGGVYDNLGLETTKQFETILVSDAGGNLKPEYQPKRNWLSHLLRSLFIIDNQVRSLRKRRLIEAFVAGERKGAYWGIRTNIADYCLEDALDCPFDKTIQLANIATRLKKLRPEIQERLINWGYAACDAAMRKHVDSTLPKPSGFPYPKVGVG